MATGEGRCSEGRDWLGTVSFGFFLLILGVVWMTTPYLLNEVIEFVKDFRFESVTWIIVLPAPQSSHPVVYGAAMQFCLAFGVSQVVLLALRFVLRESLDRKAGTVSGIVFWLGAAFFLNLLAADEIGWFGFLAGLIICIGLLIIVGSVVRLLFKRV